MGKAANTFHLGVEIALCLRADYVMAKHILGLRNSPLNMVALWAIFPFSSFPTPLPGLPISL